MRDHWRILGTLFLVWAALQAVGALVLGVFRPEGAGVYQAPVLFWVMTALVVVAFSWTGVRLRAHDPRTRIPAIILCVLALLSFPVGTALGAYGLWALFRQKEAGLAGP